MVTDISICSSEISQASAAISAVLEIQIGWPHRAVLTAAHPVSIAREPPIKPVDERAHERDLEQPRKQAPLRQHLQQLFKRGGRLPGPSVTRTDHLHRFHVRPLRNPRESRADS